MAAAQLAQMQLELLQHTHAAELAHEQQAAMDLRTQNRRQQQQLAASDSQLKAEKERSRQLEAELQESERARLAAEEKGAPLLSVLVLLKAARHALTQSATQVNGCTGWPQLLARAQSGLRGGVTSPLSGSSWGAKRLLAMLL